MNNIDPFDLEDLREQIQMLLSFFDSEDDAVEIRLIGTEAGQYPFSLYAPVWQWLQTEAPAIRTKGSESSGYREVIEDGGLRRLMRENARGYNVYFGVNPRRRRFPGDGLYHGKKSDVERVRVCHADIDKFRPEEVEAMLNAAGLKATAIVVSNTQVFGCHPYLAYRESPAVSEGSSLINRYEGMNRRFTAMFKDVAKSDDVQDISRILRVPGMINWPDERKRAAGRVPSMCKMHSCDPCCEYTLEELDKLLPALVCSPFDDPAGSDAASITSATAPAALCQVASGIVRALRTAVDYNVSEADPEILNRALAYMEKVWNGDPADARQPRGIRNCRDMRLLAHDFGLGVAAAVRILSVNRFDPDPNEQAWKKYLGNECESAFGNKVADHVSDAEMLEIQFVPKPTVANLPRLPPAPEELGCAL